MGSVAEALLGHAFDSRADLLVCGAYGHSRAREWLLGNDEGALRAHPHAPVPVTLTHRDARAMLKDILVPLSDSSADDAAIRFAVEIGRSQDARVRIIETVDLPPPAIGTADPTPRASFPAAGTHVGGRPRKEPQDQGQNRRAPGVSVEVHEAGIESPAELAARLAFSADLAIVGGWSGFAKADPAGVALFNALLLTREGPLWWCRRIGGQATTRVRLWVGKTPQTHAAPCTARSHCYSRCRLSFWWRYAAIRTRWRVLLALSQLPSLNTSGAGASPHRPPGCLPDTAVPARSCSITPARPRRR